MYVGNDFIGDIVLEKQKITVPGYVGNRKRELIEQNKELLLHNQQEPEFLLMHFPFDHHVN